MSVYFTPTDDEIITAKARAGATDRQIAAALGRSQLSIGNRRRSLGVAPMNNRGNWTRADEAKLLEMRAAGSTLREIGDALGRTFQNVSKKLERMDRRAAADPAPVRRGRPLGSTKRPPTDMAVALVAEIAKLEANIAYLTSTLEMMRALADRIGAAA